jgi:hypothetical protein
VELLVDGVIFTVSMQYPSVGDTGWMLTKVDAEEASVRIARAGDLGSAGKHGAAHGYTIGFSRRDPDHAVTSQARHGPAAMQGPSAPPPFFTR